MAIAELAELASAAWGSIADWESGATMPRRTTIETIRRTIEDGNCEVLNHGSPGVRPERGPAAARQRSRQCFAPRNRQIFHSPATILLIYCATL